MKIPAIRIFGKVFKGSRHIDAIEDALRAFTKTYKDQLALAKRVDDGEVLVEFGFLEDDNIFHMSFSTGEEDRLDDYAKSYFGLGADTKILCI